MGKCYKNVKSALMLWRTYDKIDLISEQEAAGWHHIVIAEAITIK